MSVTCSRCEGLGEWEEGPLPARAPQIDPEYRQVICPDCGGEGKFSAEVEAKAISLAMDDILTREIQWGDDDYTAEDDRQHYRSLARAIAEDRTDG